MNPHILFEDNDLLVIDKLSGVLVHTDGRQEEDTVCDWFLRTFPESKEAGEAQTLHNGKTIFRSGVVHRLDRETSGVLILVKTKEAHALLKQAFQERTIKKEYLAFCYGVPKEQKGIIDFSIGRSRKDFRLRSAQPKASGTLREAITEYEVIASIGTHSFLRVSPKTGRTHQIRVHLKAIHHPVVCDPLYAPNHPCNLGFSRLALHAYRLSLPGGQSFTAPLPNEFKEAMKRFGIDSQTPL